MRSKEVAALAGVSVRTLRHYHQIGVLPEPSRGTNNYRSYELSHVARLLRIRTLAELGVPLERMTSLLDAPSAVSNDDLLAHLADQLDERIAHLQVQLRRVEELRSTQARLDLSPVLASFLEAIGGGPSADLEEDALILVARLFEVGGSPAELQDLATVLRGLMEHEQYAEFATRFESLTPDAPGSEVAELATFFISTFGRELTLVIDTAMDGRLRTLRAQDVPAVDVDPRLNDAQAAVLRRIGEQL